MPMSQIEKEQFHQRVAFDVLLVMIRNGVELGTGDTADYYRIQRVESAVRYADLLVSEIDKGIGPRDPHK